MAGLLGHSEGLTAFQAGALSGRRGGRLGYLGGGLLGHSEALRASLEGGLLGRRGGRKECLPGDLLDRMARAAPVPLEVHFRDE